MKNVSLNQIFYKQLELLFYGVIEIFLKQLTFENAEAYETDKTNISIIIRMNKQVHVQYI